MSVNENSTQAAHILFDTLRWAENIPQAKVIFFPNIIPYSTGEDKLVTTTTTPPCSAPPDALTLTIHDKLTRAASGVMIDSFHEACPV
jgi:hypothetical protein